MTTATLLSQSPILDTASIGGEAQGIDRHELNQDEARKRFGASNERQNIVSTRIKAKRNEHASSQNRHRKEGEDLINGIDVNSEDELESPQRRLARLRRELAEVEDELQQQKVNSKEGAPSSMPEQESQRLNEVLSLVEGKVVGSKSTSPARLLDRLSKTSLANGHQTTADAPEMYASKGGVETANDDVVHQGGSFLLISGLDTRLKTLEDALGIDTIPIDQQKEGTFKPLLPTMDKLDKQLNVLSTSTDRSVEQSREKIAEMTREADALGRRQDQVGTIATGSENRVNDNAIRTDEGESLQNTASLSKINALYGTLDIIESMAPLLPSVLDRLRSLRDLHANAASASQSLTQIEDSQAEMKEEIQKWRDGLQKVENAITESQSSMQDNVESVEGWVKELELRIKSAP